MRIAPFIVPLLLLTACGAASPTWMPSGYSWHNQLYKAQPGPEAKSLGYKYSDAQNESINGTWAEVAHELVDDLEAKTGMTAQTVYVERLPASNAFNLSLDNALRDELSNRGYILADEPSGVVHLKYQAYRVGDERKRVEELYNGDDKPLGIVNPDQNRPFQFVLTLIKDGTAFGEVRSVHNIPAYGYVAGEGNLIPAPRVMEGNKQ